MTDYDAPKVPVFLEPTGRRWRHIRRATLVLGVITTVLVAYLIAGVLPPPTLPVWRIPRPDSNARHGHASPRLHERAREQLMAAFSRPERSPVPATAYSRTGRAVPTHVGFYVNWDDDAWQSLQRHVGQLDWVVAEWGFLSPHALELRTRDDQRVRTLLAEQPLSARPRLLALITNVDSGGATFGGARVAQQLQRPEARARFVQQVVDYVTRDSLRGIVLDFEQIPVTSAHSVTLLLRELRAALALHHALVGVTVAADESASSVREWGHAADVTFGMLYDEHSATEDAGPVAGQRWFEEAVRRLEQLVPNDRLIVALGSYGYEWTDAVPREPATALTYAEALDAAREHAVLPQWDTTALQPYVAWTDADSTDHVIWYLDAVTAWNQLQVAQRLGVAGYAVWRLGAEDPALWRVFGTHRAVEVAWDALRTMPAPYGVRTNGNGELLRVTARPRSGSRTLAFDRTRGFITRESVHALPAPWTVERTGANYPHRVALTFDDGPDGTWTPQLLDTLAAHHVKATFFVIGEQALAHPALLRRLVDEGHLLGGHTFTHPDLSRSSSWATRMEVDATERLIEAVTGNRALLFRPPYFGDAEPSTIDELEPIAEVSQLGYLTAGVHVDSDDWKLPGTKAIIGRTLAARAKGQVVLMHDGGGDRTQTLAAVGPIIDSLRARGDTLVTMDALVNAPRAALLAPLSAAQSDRRWLDMVGYRVLGALVVALPTVFAATVVLSVGRLLLITVAAGWQRWRHTGVRANRSTRTLSPWPAVTVLIPAYKEEAVIVATVRSILAQQYPGPLDVVVIDDGSPDGTYDVARNTFAGDTRVQVLHKPNGGKASALNVGLAHVRGDVFVALDADTVFAPHAITNLVAPLRDAQVGAVAGNAKVGNRLNIVTRWQALEYVTSQNLDRRAFELMNAITVVPGAIGAWRTSAVLAAGGFSHDTLAEDQDLTIALRRAGWRIRYADDAIAWTEAPATLRTLARQRFRWAFGTLQCAWKHRDVLFRPRFGSLGVIAMPNTLVFQLLLAALSPIADMLFVISLAGIFFTAQAHGLTYARTDLEHVIAWYALLVGTELVCAITALYMEPNEERSLAWLVLLQRFVYRQLMYWVVLRSIVAAVRGRVVGWGSLERHATATARAAAAGLIAFVLCLSPRTAQAQTDNCPTTIARMPISEVPSSTGNTLVLFWSGDGGWQALPQQMSRMFAEHGMAVVGVNSRSWLTSGTQSPTTLQHDSVCLLRTYLARWHRDRVLLVGFSRGAGFLALLPEALPADLRERVNGVVLLGVEHTASFEFHLLDLVRTVSRPTDIEVLPALRRMEGVPLVCVYGRDETDTVCPSLDPKRATIIARDGGHHFDEDYPGLTRDILMALERR